MTNETTNYIEQLRKYDGFSGYDNADETEEIAYFEVDEERPATEMQEGADFRYSFREVVPKEVTVIQYVGGMSE